MEKAQVVDDSTIQNLKDAGCDEAFILRFAHLGGENATDRLALLREHRANLLQELHEDQRRIDCLDYLIYQIQKTSNRWAACSSPIPAR